MQNNYNIQTGYLIDNDNKAFDVSVILNFPTEADYDNCTSLSDFPSVNLIDFYFGTPNDHDTETYLARFIEKQNNFKTLLQTLYEFKALCPDNTEIDKQIVFVKSQLVQLH